MRERIFFHGTHKSVAYSIMRQGFKIGQEAAGRNLGAGLYLTTRVGFAAVWGDIILRCKFVRGTRILWHTPIDLAMIRYLKKEFGAGVTEPNFDKVIPHNKQLTRSELAQLWNYLIKRHYMTARSIRRDFLPRFARNFPFIYKHLKRHGYQGVGIAEEEWPEMFLFNPSSAVPLSAHAYSSTGWRSDWIKDNVILSEALTLAQLREIQEKELRARINFDEQRN